MERQREEDENKQQQPDQQGEIESGEPELVLHRYHVEGGGVILSSVPLEEAPQPPIVDSQEPETDQRPTPRKTPPFLRIVLMIFCLFLFLDSADTTLTALFSPTATITIIPTSQQITLKSTLQLGRLTTPLTISQSQTIPTTGHGHQDASVATGTLTLYNGLFTPQTIAAGTAFTGQDGIAVVTDQSVTIPANTPPVDGQATVSAHATLPGAAGNIQAGAIRITINNGLLVKNNQFQNGQDARDFQVVTTADIATTAATLTQKVTASMSAALQGQLLPTEQEERLPCHPTTTSDHQPGNQASQVQITVSETCTIIAYNAQELSARATKLLTTQARKQVGTSYRLYGSVQVDILHAIYHQTATPVLLTVTSSGTWVYTVNQQQLLHLIAGKPRRTALAVLTHLPGVQRATISGIADDQELPNDLSHLHLLVILSTF
jgi:hypothetical protein